MNEVFSGPLECVVSYADHNGFTLTTPAGATVVFYTPDETLKIGDVITLRLMKGSVNET
jgi:hypothetical protein